LKLIDANVFIYAAGDDHPNKAPCLRVLDNVHSGELEANTDIEVLQEILHYYQRRGDAAFGAEVVDHALAVVPEPLAITVTVLLTAGEMLRAHSSLEARDAVHAAVVLGEGLEGIISADRGFDAIAGITRFDPMDL
jgi:predicted nucleic acid-binding protein